MTDEAPNIERAQIDPGRSTRHNNAFSICKTHQGVFISRREGESLAFGHDVGDLLARPYDPDDCRRGGSRRTTTRDAKTTRCRRCIGTIPQRYRADNEIGPLPKAFLGRQLSSEIGTALDQGAADIANVEARAFSCDRLTPTDSDLPGCPDRICLQRNFDKTLDISLLPPLDVTAQAELSRIHSGQHVAARAQVVLSQLRSLVVTGLCLNMCKRLVILRQRTQWTSFPRCGWDPFPSGSQFPLRCLWRGRRRRRRGMSPIPYLIQIIEGIRRRSGRQELLARRILLRIWWLLSTGIPENYRAVSRVSIQIRTSHQTGWICSRPPAQPRRVIPRSVLIQTTLYIPLLPRISISLRGLRLAPHRLIGRAAVGRVLLVGNDLRSIV